MGARLRGRQRVLAKLDAMDRAAKGTPVATRELAESILVDVQSSRPGAGVPRDTGELANSGRAAGPDERGMSRVTFDAPHALIVHELSASHETGESRYLVRGLERAESAGDTVRALRSAGKVVVREGRAR